MESRYYRVYIRTSKSFKFGVEGHSWVDIDWGSWMGGENQSERLQILLFTGVFMVGNDDISQHGICIIILCMYVCVCCS